MQKILISGPAWIGDMVMTQTLLMILRQHHPQAQLDVLAPKWALPVLHFMPEVNNIIEAPFRHGKMDFWPRLRLSWQLRHQKYDQAIILQNSIKSALIPWLAGIPRRTSWRGEFRYSLINDIYQLNPTEQTMMIQRFAMLGLSKDSKLPEPLPWPQLIVKQDEAQKVAAKYDLRPLTNKILGLCPGAEFGPAKRWPAKYFAEVAQQKIADGWQVWLFGGPKDQTIAAEIQQLSNNKCVDLVGKTSLSEAIYLLALTDTVIANDTGLMHIAAALNRNLIAIYGSTPPDFAPPLTLNAKSLCLNLPCSPCRQRECPLKHFRCMRDLKPQLVLTAIEQLATL